MVVKIKILILLFFIVFSSNSHASKNLKIIRDAEIEFFLNKIIKIITSKLDKQNQQFYPRLILNSDYNAFVTGSNKIYINTGLINQATSISEIQGVIAHEIGHLVLNHYSSRLINRDLNSNYSTIAAIAGIALAIGNKLDSNSAVGLMIGSQDLANKSHLQFTRIQEQQADKFALDIMKKSKISLNGLEYLLDRLSNEEILNKSERSSFYRSHPYSKLRLKQLKRYKDKSFISNIKNSKIIINKNEITLAYINNKINVYNSNPFDILNNKKKETKLLSKYSLVIAYQKIGKYELALDNLKKLTTQFKNYPFFYELHGDILFAKGDFIGSIKNYEKAIYLLDDRLDNNDNLIKLSLVKAYLETYKTNNINKSIVLLEELVQNNSNWSYLWRLLAKASGMINKKEISYIALAEEAVIKKKFIKAKKYVNLAFKYPQLSASYRIRGKDILARIKEKK